MPTKKIVNLLLTTFTILVVANSLCKDMDQPPALCTACGDLDLMLEKNCYPKMRGCLAYALPGPVCTECQSGYVLYQSKCIRQAVFKNLNSSEIPPIVIEKPPALTYEEIKAKIGDLYGPYFTDANEQILSTHPELGKGNVKQVRRLDTKKGQYFIISYESTANTNKYEAVSILNHQGKVSPVSFKVAETQAKDPITADTQIRSILGTRLTNFFIYDIKFVNSQYTFFYMDAAFNIVQVQFNMNDIGPTLATKMMTKNQNAGDLALEQLYLKYPEMKTRTLLATQRMEDFYAFTFDSDTTASVRFTPSFNFEVNKPIKTSLKLPGYDIYGYFNGFFDMFGLFSIFNPAYYACLNLATSQVPELSSALPLFSSSLTVPLPNGQQDFYFNISLTKNLFRDNYNVYAVYTAAGGAELQLVRKGSSTIIYSARYNYNADPLFFKSYLNASATSKVQLIPSITFVLMKVVDSNTLYYKVTYSASEFMEFRYNKISGATTLVSYTVDGKNIVAIVNAVGSTTQKKQPELYLQYLSTKKLVDPSSDLISFIFNPVGTILSYVNNLGTYKANITSTFTTNINQVSNINCYDFTEVNKYEFDNLDKFLRANYNLNGYTKLLAQSKVNKIGNIFRILYSNPKQKQVEFQIQQLYTLPNVLKTTAHNGGYELVDENPQNPDYQKIVTYLKSPEFQLAGSRMPLLTEANVKEIRCYYNDGVETWRIGIRRDGGNASAEVVQGRVYPAIPAGFKENNLISSAKLSVEDQANLEGVLFLILSQHPEMVGSTPIFIQKQPQSYKLMYKTPQSQYISLTAISETPGTYTVQNFTLTSYKDSDFFGCAALNAKGWCPSCTANQQMYQGFCWAKLEGCRAQAGKICLRCANPYVLDGGKCKKECMDLLP